MGLTVIPRPTAMTHNVGARTEPHCQIYKCEPPRCDPRSAFSFFFFVLPQTASTRKIVIVAHALPLCADHTKISERTRRKLKPRQLNILQCAKLADARIVLCRESTPSLFSACRAIGFTRLARIPPGDNKASTLRIDADGKCTLTEVPGAFFWNRL